MLQKVFLIEAFEYSRVEVDWWSVESNTDKLLDGGIGNTSRWLIMQEDNDHFAIQLVAEMELYYTSLNTK